MTAKILCIVPYPGLKNKIEYSFKKMTKRNPKLNVKIQIELANMANKRKLSNLVKNNYFDLLLSRGGTFDFLKGQTNAPVIDIGISQYDIIRTIRNIPDPNKTAIICYDAFNQAITETLAQFNIKMKKFVVKKKIDINKAMNRLSTMGYNNVLCDSGIILTSNNIHHFNSYLIESGDEVVTQALKTCFFLLKEKQKNVNYFSLLSESLKSFHDYTLFFEKGNYFNILFSTNKKKADSLAQKIRKALSEHKQILVFDDSSWHMLVKQTKSFSIVMIDNLGQLSQQNRVPEYDFEYISSIYSICYDKHFFKLLDYYSDLATPLCLVGEEGLAKEYLCSLIVRRIRNQKLKPILLTLSNHEEIHKAITNTNSPFFENHHLIQLSGIEKLSQNDQLDLFDFIHESNLASRNKLVFLIDQPYGTKLSVVFPDSLNVNHLFLKPLSEMSYEIFNQLVHSILNDFSLKTGKTFSGVSDTALDQLSSYPWPQNYREFINVLTTALATSSGPILRGKDIADILRQFATAEKSKPQILNKKKATNYTKLNLHDIIVQEIKQVLKENRGNKTKTAKQLDISRATLWRYLK